MDGMKRLPHTLTRHGALLLALLLLAGCAATPTVPPRIAVTSSQPLATQAGLRALEQGGNAFDAAIAMAAVLAVVEPYDASLGGSGLYLVRKDRDKVLFVDGRSAAPAPRGAHSSAAIPGQPAALLYLSRHYAERPLEADLADAIRLAESGFRPGPVYRHLAAARLPALQAAGRQLLAGNGSVPEKGARLRQPALARTLKALADRGKNAFYRGQGAARTRDAGSRIGLNWQASDLADYRVLTGQAMKTPLGADVLMTAPSPAGTLLAERMALARVTPVPPHADTVGRIHHLASIMRLTRADVVRHPRMAPGDLLTPLHLKFLASQIDPLRAASAGQDSQDTDFTPATTTFSVLDGRGNALTATLTLGRPFGSGQILPGTGILLSDTLSRHDGLTRGTHIASEMTPVIFRRPRTTTFTGTGGSRDSTDSTFLVLWQVMKGTPTGTAVSAPRFSVTIEPARFRYESGLLDAEQRFQLQTLGYALESEKRGIGELNWINAGAGETGPEAGTDPRGLGQALTESAPD